MAREPSDSATRSRTAAPEPPRPPLPPPRHVYRWDLDKTYLKTDFDTLRDLLRSAVEGAEKKQAVPGAAALLRELKRGPEARVCFISGSPREMRRVLTRKLQLDGVEFDEFILKPNLRNIFRGRFRALREQVGYKLPALLAGRAGLPEETLETCFGDDAEADAFVYSLYADVIAGRVDRAILERILVAARVYEDDAARTLALADSIPHADAVQRIFIRLDRYSPTARFDRYGPRLVPVYNYFQAALVLLEDGLLDEDGAIRVTLEMVDRFGYSHDALKNSLGDLVRRDRLRPGTPARLADRVLAGASTGFGALGSLPASRDALTRFADRIHAQPEGAALHSDAHGARTAARTVAIDYLKAFEEDVPRR